MIFTSCQEKAIINIEKFLIDKNENIFILEGSAGTGKTTIITAFEKKRTDLKIIYTAPTHKAVRVLKEMGKKNLNYNKNNYKTLHKFFKLKLDYKQDGSSYLSYNLQIFKSDLSKYNSNILLIIDEVSMISKELYNIIIHITGNMKIKTICLGDRCQLPPIYKIDACDDDDEDEPQKITSLSIEALSPFFITDFKYTSKLTEIKRTSNEDLKNLYAIFRQYTLDEDTDNFKNSLISFKKMNISTFIKIVTSKNHFTKDINENIEKDNAYVICARKNTVKNYVSNIKNKLYPDSVYPFNIDERIYITNYYEFNNSGECDCEYNNRQSIFCNKNTFYTSEEYQIVTCNKNTIFSEYFKQSYDCYEFEINYILHDGTNLKLRNVCENSYKLFNDNVLKTKNEIKKIENNSELWKKFYFEKNFLHSPFTSSYAITAYKSQGSTYDYVFIDGNDIEECRRTTFLKSKELYTAATRTRKYICLYVELEKEYMEMPSGILKCIRCRCWRNSDQYKLNKKGQFIKTCIICSDKAKEKRLNKE